MFGAELAPVALVTHFRILLTNLEAWIGEGKILPEMTQHPMANPGHPTAFSGQAPYRVLKLKQAEKRLLHCVSEEDRVLPGLTHGSSLDSDGSRPDSARRQIPRSTLRITLRRSRRRRQALAFSLSFGFS
jgi:hypothetical protein